VLLLVVSRIRNAGAARRTGCELRNFYRCCGDDKSYYIRIARAIKLWQGCFPHAAAQHRAGAGKKIPRV
jgi:hypothetical protein